jgi:hypothetical protein
MPFWLVHISMEIDFITHCHVVIYEVNIIIIKKGETEGGIRDKF